MVGAADQPRAPLAGLQIDVETELAGDHDLVPERHDGFAKNPLALMRAIGLGGVKKGDAAFIGRADDIDHLGAGRDRRLVGAGHVLDTEADTGDFKLTELAPAALLSG